MPSWNIHLEAGEKIAQKLRFSGQKKREFLFGCLLPDVNNGYINNPEIVRPHHETHYAYDQKSSLNFYAENQSKINQKIPLYLGYLFHLYTDGFFNYDYYRKIKRDPSFLGKTDQEKVNIKHHDFWLYDTNFHHTISIGSEEADRIAAKANHISAVQISAKDILEVINFLKNNNINNHLKNDQYIFYNKETLDNLMEDLCESFTNDYLEES